MALKAREKRKEYTIDEMLQVVNLKFIKKGTISDYVPPHFVLGVTCFKKEEDRRFIMSDSRDDDDEWDDVLPTYYGKTILDVVTKCFDDRDNHG